LTHIALAGDDKLHDDISALGWFGIAIPEAYGGIGLSLAEVVPVAEQIGRRLVMIPFLPTTLTAQAILTGGTEAQKQTYLPRIAEGTQASLALFERNGSFDLADIETSAVETETGYTLTGTKVLVENYAAAQVCVMTAKLNGQVQAFVCSAEHLAGATYRREILIDETKRCYELTLDGVDIPRDCLMESSQTFAMLQHIEMAASLLGSAELIGAAQACIDYTVDYLKTRKQFGKLIGSYQALKHPVVDAYVGYEKARSLLYAAANSFDEQGKGEVATRMANVAAGRALSYAADRSIQFHGGFGFTYDCDAQLYRRRAIFHDSQYGDLRWHKAKLAELLFN